MRSWYFYYYALGPIVVVLFLVLISYLSFKFFKKYIKPTNSYQKFQAFIQHISVANDFLTIEQRTYLSLIVVIITLLLLIINPWLVTVFALFPSIVATWAYSRGQDLRQIRKRKYLLGIAGILVWLVIFIQFRTVIGQSAGIGAITILIALKLFEIDKRRDAIVLIFLSQILVMGIFFFSQEIQDALVAIIIEILLVSAQAVIFQQSQAFWKTQFSTIKTSTKLITGSLILGIIIFIFFPRPSEPLWNYGLPQNVSKSGLSDNMSPGSIDQLVLSHEIAFQVDFLNNNIPKNHQRYWRGPVLTNYSNNLWRKAISKFSPVDIAQNVIDDATKSDPQSVWQYQIIIEPTFRKWIYTLDTPVQISPEAVINNFGLVESNRYINSRKSFEITSINKFRHPNLNKQLTLTERKNYVQIPSHALQREPRLQALVNQWVKQENINQIGTPLSPLSYTATQKIVNRALQYFRNQNFIYTLQPPILTKDNPNDNFLFDTQRGFCEHYAGAFTLLMRAAGIPARVVTGYQGGEINPLTGVMVVRQSDAHAWSEVWLAGQGWVRIDPTSAVAPDRIERSLVESLSNSNDLSLLSNINTTTLFRQISLGWEALRIQWNRWVILYDKESQFKLFNNLSLPQLDTKQLLSIVISIFFLFLVIAYVQNRPSKTIVKPNNKAWYKLIKKLQNQGIDVNHNLTLPILYQKVNDHYQNNKSTKPNQKIPKKLKNIKFAIKLISKIKYQKISISKINIYNSFLNTIIRRL